jgi:hypothetical protein
MAKGGKRVGAGRPLGSVGTKTREIANRAIKEGITPLEVMLRNMRHFNKLAESAEAVLSELSVDAVANMQPADQFKHLLAEVKKAAGLRELAQNCARDAAPFIHPRLASIESNVTVNDKRDVSDWNRDELVEIIGNATTRGARTTPTNGRGDEPDQLH